MTLAKGIRMMCINKVLVIKLLKYHVIALECGVMMRVVGAVLNSGSTRVFRTSHKRRGAKEDPKWLSKPFVPNEHHSCV